MDPVISSKYWCYDDLGFGSSLWKVTSTTLSYCGKVWYLLKSLSIFWLCCMDTYIHTYIHIVIVKWFLVWCPVMVHSGIYQQYDLSREPQSDCFFLGGEIWVFCITPRNYLQKFLTMVFNSVPNICTAIKGHGDIFFGVSFWYHQNDIKYKGLFCRWNIVRKQREPTDGMEYMWYLDKFLRALCNWMIMMYLWYI